MNRIQILPDSVKKRIAAGEVVEGPFSVVKELMENSIDSGAAAIDVEVVESGLKKVVVRDNGSGIVREDLPLAVMEHATSKIRDDSDIEHIGTLGFRGEALSSISSISRVTIFSRATDEPSGGRLSCREGSIEMTDYAGPAGTTVIVENLFYNTPARKKFLKSRGTELRNIKNAFLRIALAHPGIAFSLTGDEKRLFTLGAAPSVGERIDQVYGAGILESLYFESLHDMSARIRGYLSKPDFLKSTRSMQMMYVNGRLVEYRYLGFILTRAYEAMAPRGRYPAAIIFLDIEPGLVDVNIHPAKREIKFFDQKYIDSLIENLCRKALGARAHRVDAGLVREAPLTHAGTGTGSGEAARTLFAEQAPGGYPERDAAVRTVAGEGSALYRSAERDDGICVRGVVFNTYVLFEEDDSLHFIDFHAAHERFIYDELMTPGRPPEIQELMFPVEIELAPFDRQVLEDNAEVLGEIGFDTEVFSENTVIVRGAPATAPGIRVEEFVRDFIESLKGEEAGGDDIRKIAAREAACHTAKRSGDDLSHGDIEAIIKKTLSGAHEQRCPHGRPFHYTLNKKDLERIFKRS